MTGPESEFPPTEPLAAGSAPVMPERIGRYRITGLLGIGGMGLVYAAEQDNPRRPVALKVIRPGALSSATLRRFELETRVLARLEHPGIARILDAGTTAGPEGVMPYFAMELVDGEPITVNARRRGLSSRERVALLAEICDAVEHAHRKGVIHRDLKPGNILVDASGRPRILDFGVARATDPELQASRTMTVAGQIVGTLPYMSPEQLEGDPDLVDTRADVYALGVVAYELLSGRTPHALASLPAVQAMRAILEEDAPRLSTIDRRLRGDLETIVSRALEKDRERRYAGAAELAADLRSFLAHEPIAAREPSAWYHLRKLARRHRVAAAAAAGLAATLVVGIAATGWGLARERAQRRRAETEAAKAMAVTKFLQDMLARSTPEESQGRDVTVAELLDLTASSLQSQFRDEPEIEGALRHAVGAAELSLGRWDLAEEQLRRAVDLRRQLAPAGSRDLARSLVELGSLWRRRGDFAGAEPILKEALAMTRRLAEEPDPDVALALQRLGELRLSSGQAAESVSLLDEAIAQMRNIPGEESALASALLVLAQARTAVPAPADGTRAILGEALALHEKLLGSESYQYSVALAAHARFLQDHGTAQEGVEAGRRALVLQRRVLPPGHPQLGAALRNLGMSLRHAGDLAGAERLLREAVSIERGLHPDGHLDLAEALEFLSHVTGAMGRQAETVALIEEDLAIKRSILGDDHLLVAKLLDHYAYQRRGLVDPRDNEALILEAMAITKGLLPANAGFYAKLMGSLATCYADQGRYDEALEWAELRLANLDATGLINQELGWALGWIARLRYRKGERDEAIRLVDVAIGHMRSWGGEGHGYLSPLLGDRARWLLEAGRTNEAARDYTDELVIEDNQAPGGSESAAEALAGLAAIDLQRGQARAAASLASEAVAMRNDPSTPSFDAVRVESLDVLAHALDANGEMERAADAAVACLQARASAPDPDEDAVARTRVLATALLRRAGCAAQARALER